MGKLPFQILALAFVIGCTGSPLGSAGSRPPSPEHHTKETERPSEDNGGIPGYQLGCTWVEGDNVASEAEYKCALVDSSQKKVSLPQIASTWKWQSSFEIYDSVAITELNDLLWHIRLKFGALANQHTLRASLNSVVTLTYRSLATGRDEKIQKIIIDSLSATDIAKIQAKLNTVEPGTAPAVTSYSLFRIVITSVKAVYPANDACIEELQFKVDDVWSAGSFTSPSGRLGTYDVTVAADSEYDQFTRSYNAFSGLADVKIWATAFNRFSNTFPYDFVGTPSWLAVNFGTKKVTITGLRINGGDNANDTNGQCTPDRFYLEGSNDNLNWVEIPGSRQVDVNTTSRVEFNW